MLAYIYIYIYINSAAYSIVLCIDVKGKNVVKTNSVM